MLERDAEGGRSRKQRRSEEARDKNRHSRGHRDSRQDL